MARAASTPIAHLLRSILGDVQQRVCPDAELLQRFLVGQDETAFEEILRRHGPMVMGVCQTVLPHEPDAEDAFQATFLVLLRRGGTIRKCASLASWLHGVAYRTALKAQAARVRRRQQERPGPEPEVTDPDRLTWTEVRQVLHAELERLSERYRDPLVHCYLLGATQDEAAALLGLSKGTLKRRLERGRALLRERLMGRGLGPDALLLASAWPAATALAPPHCYRATLDAARSMATGKQEAVVSPHVLALAEGGNQPMLATFSKVGTAVVLVLGMASAGLLFAPKGSEKPLPGRKADPQPSRKPEAPEPVSTDRFGDPLPPGALARLGTARLGGPAVVAPDGKTLISVGGDGSVYHWDSTTGKSHRRTELPLPAEAKGADRPLFCLTPDGKTVGVCVGKVLSVVDLASGKVRRIEVPLPRYASVYRIGLSTDGNTVAATIHGVKNEIRLWNVATGKAGPRLEHRSSMDQLAFSPDGKTLTGASLGLPVPLWDVATGKQLRTFPAGIGVYCVAFSRDGKRLATGGADGAGGAVKLWEVATGKELATLRESAPRLVEDVSFSPDGKTLAAGGQQGLALWDLETKKPLLERPGHTPAVLFSPDGKRLYTRHGGSVLTVWDVAAVRPLYHHLGHEGGLTSVAFAPDGKTVATVANGIGAHSVHLWDSTTGKHLRTLERLTGNGGRVLFTPDNAGLIAGSGDGTLRLWDLRTNREVRRFTVLKKADAQGGLVTIALSADGRRLVAVHRSPSRVIGEKEGELTLAVWDMPGGEKLFRRPFAFGANPTFSSDTSLVAYPEGNDFRIEETLSGKQLLALKLPGDGEERCTGHLVAFSPDGRQVAGVTSSYKESPGKRERVRTTLHLWELATGQEALRVDLGNTWHTALAFAPDGREVALAGRGFVQLRDVVTGRGILTHRGPSAYCWTIAFSPERKRLLAGYEDATALIWDVTARVPRIGTADWDFEQSWDHLGDEAGKAHVAGWALVERPALAVALLQKRLKPAKVIDPEPVRKLIADLASPEFSVRESATEELRRIAGQAEPLLRTALGDSPTPEQRKRIEQILPSPLPVGSRELLRSLRAVQVLERIGTPEARRTLQKLAAGGPAARLTREAKAALQRLERRATTTP